MRAARPAGCYALRRGPWSTKPPIPGPPTPFRLLAESDSVGEPPFRRVVHLVRPNIARMPGIRAIWSLGLDDSVRVTWSTGFSGFQLRVAPAGRDTLRGVVTTFSDTFVGSINTGYARAAAVVVRAPCPPTLR